MQSQTSTIMAKLCAVHGLNPTMTMTMYVPHILSARITVERAEDWTANCNWYRQRGVGSSLATGCVTATGPARQLQLGLTFLQLEDYMETTSLSGVWHLCASTDYNDWAKNCKIAETSSSS